MRKTKSLCDVDKESGDNCVVVVDAARNNAIVGAWPDARMVSASDSQVASLTRSWVDMSLNVSSTILSSVAKLF